MAKIARIPITNIYMKGDYTGRFLIGPAQKPMNLILDTGSSALAVDGRKYQPNVSGGDTITNLVQLSSYGDNSGWAGAVIKTRVTAGVGDSQVTLPDANVSVAYEESQAMFGDADGILGLAYAPLDQAYIMPGPTWPRKYSDAQLSSNPTKDIAPYLTQLSSESVISDKISFLTRRSFPHQGAGANDPLNQGWLIIGGGEESADLYTGTFQSVKVLDDTYYNTNLKAVVVGQTSPIPVEPINQPTVPSNSIVDSGTNSLNLPPRLLEAILSKLSDAQRALLSKSINHRNQPVAMSDLGDLSKWPNLTFVLEGIDQDVSLIVSPMNYWQVNAFQAGVAMPAITVSPDDEGSSILGLPLMNGYFTIFDGTANNGRGVIKFAPSR